MGEVGEDSLAELEAKHGEIAAEREYTNRWGNRFMWFPGEALSSKDQLGKGVHVYGRGRFVFLPPSLARSPGEMLPEEME